VSVLQFLKAAPKRLTAIGEEVLENWGDAKTRSQRGRE